jgi:hypothetical protein
MSSPGACPRKKYLFSEIPLLGQPSRCPKAENIHATFFLAFCTHFFVVFSAEQNTSGNTIFY